MYPHQGRKFEDPNYFSTYWLMLHFREWEVLRKDGDDVAVISSSDEAVLKVVQVLSSTWSSNILSLTFDSLHQEAAVDATHSVHEITKGYLPDVVWRRGRGEEDEVADKEL